jgi:integrase
MVGVIMTSIIKYGEWVALWLESKKDFVKMSTYANYSMAAINHIIPSLGNYTINEISEPIVQETVIYWINNGKMAGGGLSKKTVKDMLSIIKLSLKAAARKKMISSIPDMDVVIPSSNSVGKVVTFNSDEQNKILSMVLESPSPRNVGVIISLLAGLRIGELCALKWSDINMENRTIHVTKTMQRLYLKELSGTRESRVIITPPKTRSSIRIVPISSRLFLYLSAIVAEDSEAYVITGMKEFLEPRTYRSYYNRLLLRHGIEHVKFHGLRHTFATRCIEAGADCKTVSVLLGHASVNMTLNLYVHPGMDQKRKCVELI